MSDTIYSRMSKEKLIAHIIGLERAESKVKEKFERYNKTIDELTSSKQNLQDDLEHFQELDKAQQNRIVKLEKFLLYSHRLIRVVKAAVNGISLTGEDEVGTTYKATEG